MVNTSTRTRLDIVAAIGLAIGGVFGLAGTFVGQAVVSGTAAGLEASVPSFGGGVALWAAALLLISVPTTLATWVRLAGVAAAVPFAVVAARIFGGEMLLPTTAPLPFFGYPLLTLTFVGWIATLLKRA